MEQFVDSDEERASELKHRASAETPGHLLRPKPADGSKEIRVELTKKKKKKKTKKIRLRARMKSRRYEYKQPIN